jgi:hypothetical protein
MKTAENQERIASNKMLPNIPPPEKLAAYPCDKTVCDKNRLDRSDRFSYRYPAQKQDFVEIGLTSRIF